MYSLKQKILLLILSSMAVCSFLLGGVFLYTVNREWESHAVENMHYKCLEKGDQLNLSLIRTEDVVSYISHTTQDYVREPVQLRDPAFRRATTAQIQFAFENSVNDMKDVASFYVVYNYEIAGADGFWCKKNPFTGEFENQQITDVAAYGPGEPEKTLWYYRPVSQGKATWLLPYENTNIGVYMISYVQPVYKDGTLLAVVGVDIDFANVKSLLAAKQVYPRDYSFLCTPDGGIYGHPYIPDGTPGEQVGHTLTEAIYRSGNGSGYYKNIGESEGDEEYRQTFIDLKNGMKLVLSAPVSEIFQKRDRIVMKGGLLLLLLCLTAILLAAFIVQKNFQKPLSVITEAVEKVSRGNYNITLEEAGDQEIRRLAEALNQSIEYIRHREIKMQEVAYVDALTGVMNFAAYVEQVRDLRGKISTGQAEFAIVMVDINGLKYVNDNFGHDKGNISIQRVSELLGQTYGKERVYRIGGDEFVVVLEGEYYQKRKELIKKLHIYERDRDYQSEHSWEQIAFSCGMTRYYPETDTSYEMVFERVDARMYCKKEDLKK